MNTLKAGLSIVIWAAFGCAGWATDRGVAWGNVSTVLGLGTAGTSSGLHNLDSQTAVTVAGGRNTLLPGATLNSVGVLNEINVVGDDNLIDATQTGTNTGDVTTTITIND